MRITMQAYEHSGLGPGPRAWWVEFNAAWHAQREFWAAWRPLVLALARALDARGAPESALTLARVATIEEFATAWEVLWALGHGHYEDSSDPGERSLASAAMALAWARRAAPEVGHDIQRAQRLLEAQS